MRKSLLYRMARIGLAAFVVLLVCSGLAQIFVPRENFSVLIQELRLAKLQRILEREVRLISSGEQLDAAVDLVLLKDRLEALHLKSPFPWREPLQYEIHENGIVVVAPTDVVFGIPEEYVQGKEVRLRILLDPYKTWLDLARSELKFAPVGPVP